MHVGWVARFGRRPGRRSPTFAALREHIAGRLPVAPRYRQRLVSVPWAVHDPLWIDDPEFRIERHVLAAGSSDVREVTDDVMSRPLARDRALWEMWIADDVEGDGFSLVGKAHHCMVDGLAAVELGMLLLDPVRDVAPRTLTLGVPTPLRPRLDCSATPCSTVWASRSGWSAICCASAGRRGGCCRFRAAPSVSVGH
jgi:hypothetical protein